MLILGRQSVATALTLLCFYNSPQVLNGGQGVDVFFAISGFLIAHIWISEVSKTGGFRWAWVCTRAHCMAACSVGAADAFVHAILLTSYTPAPPCPPNPHTGTAASWCAACCASGPCWRWRWASWPSARALWLLPTPLPPSLLTPAPATGGRRVHLPPMRASLRAPAVTQRGDMAYEQLPQGLSTAAHPPGLPHSPLLQVLLLVNDVLRTECLGMSW